MASTASTLSWSSSSLLQSFAANTNEACKLSDRRTGLVVFAQKKAKKARTVIIRNGFSSNTLVFRYFYQKVQNLYGLCSENSQKKNPPQFEPHGLLSKIILKEDIADLGKKGELRSVKAGYYRNYLLPLGKAQLVTPVLLKEMKMEDERIEAEKIRVKEEAQQLAIIFETVGGFKVKRKGGKGKLIFGSVTPQDLVDIIKAQLNRDVDKRIVSLPDIREIGEYIAELKLHPEVTAKVRVIVSAN